MKKRLLFLPLAVLSAPFSSVSAAAIAGSDFSTAGTFNAGIGENPLAVLTFAGWLSKQALMPI